MFFCGGIRKKSVLFIEKISLSRAVVLDCLKLVQSKLGNKILINLLYHQKGFLSHRCSMKAQVGLQVRFCLTTDLIIELDISFAVIVVKDDVNEIPYFVGRKKRNIQEKGSYALCGQEKPRLASKF